MANPLGIPSRDASAAELLARLVSFNMTSGNSNLQLIGFVRAWLDACGVPYHLSTVCEPSLRSRSSHTGIACAARAMARGLPGHSSQPGLCGDQGLIQTFH
jgi:hypothetical protein